MPDDEEQLRVGLHIDTGALDEIEQRLRSIQSQLDGIMGEQPGLDGVRHEVDQLEASLNKVGLTRDPGKAVPGEAERIENWGKSAQERRDRFDVGANFKRNISEHEAYLNSITDTVRQQTDEMRQHQRNIEELGRVDELKRRTEDQAQTEEAPTDAGAPRGKLSSLRDLASRFGSYVRQGRDEVERKIGSEQGKDRHLEEIVRRPGQLIDRVFRTAGITATGMLSGSTAAFYGGVGAAVGAGVGVVSRGAATVVAKGTELLGMGLGAAAGGILGAVLKVPGLARAGAQVGGAGGRFAGTIAGNVIAGAGEMIASTLGPLGAMAGMSMEQSAQAGMARSDASARLTAMGGGGGMLGTAGGMGYVTEEGAGAAGGYLQATGSAAGFEGFLRFGRGHGITPEEQLSYAPIFRMAGGTMPGGPGWEDVMRMGTGAARRSGLEHARLPEFLGGTTQLAEQMMGQKDVMGAENIQGLMGMQALIGRMGEAYQGERGSNFLGRINTAITQGGGGGARKEFMLQALGFTPGQDLESRLTAERRLEEGMANMETFGAILRHTQETYGGGFLGQRALAGLLGLRQEEARKLQTAYETSPEEFEKTAKLLELGKEDPIAKAMISGAESWAVHMEAMRLETAAFSMEMVERIHVAGKDAAMVMIGTITGEGDVEGHMNSLANNFRGLIHPLGRLAEMLYNLVKGPSSNRWAGDAPAGEGAAPTGSAFEVNPNESTEVAAQMKSLYGLD